ncbi:MAG: hypothetical protein SGJ21_08510 [Alphaproteobacteria bacterium]|nr:hypothetical protein [Alphaproteobacteria bacterium]
MVADVISGRDALHRLDRQIAEARGDFDQSLKAADAHGGRRAELLRLRAEGYRELARMRLDELKTGAEAALSAAEAAAVKLLEAHQQFMAGIEGEAEQSAAELAASEAGRLAAEQRASAAVDAYETLVAATEARIEADPAYDALTSSYEEAKAVHARATQKLELARTDRTAKGAPYESDPLFAYLWERRFRTTEYRGRGITRALDGWVAKVSGYDQAYLNYARLIELPDRLSEHLSRMKLEEAEAEAAIERFEATALEADGARALSDAAASAKAEVKAADARLDGLEAAEAALRTRREAAASGDSGPQGDARRLIEDGLVKASFPDLKVLAAETTSLDDDRMVDVLIKLRTEELAMEVSGRSLGLVPARRRGTVEALEAARQRFKAAGLDGPYVELGGAAFEAALMAYGGASATSGEQLWRALAATVRQAPAHEDSYFGGRRRRETIGAPGGLPGGLGDVVGGLAGVIISEVIRESVRGGMRGRWGGGGSGGGWGGSSGGRSSGGGGFRTGGRSGGGGFKTGGRF